MKTATADFNSTTLTPIAADEHKDQPHNATDAEVPDGAPKRLFQRPPKPRGKINKIFPLEYFCKLIYHQKDNHYLNIKILMVSVF